MKRLVLSRKLRACLILVATYGSLLLAVTQTFAQDFVVVANSGLGVSEVSHADIQQMLLGKKSTWSSGERVIFCLFGDSEMQAAFLKEFVNKTPMQFKSYWKRLVFTGKGRMPKYFKTKEDVAAYVKAHPGAFSFLPAPGADSLKIIAVK